MSLGTGSRIGQYEITHRLGAGGMGEVYAALDRSLNREVAVKVLPAAVASDPERIARFSREAHTLALLNHPHIAQVYGFEDGDGVTALVMELVDGRTLADLLGSGPLPLGDALDIARQIAEAMEYAHEQGIVHRDLKPANVKVRPDGTVKVLDFGLAKAMAADHTSRVLSSAIEESPTITSPALTEAGVILGTAAYMAPEQARGKAMDRRVDIWAFGCVLFEMLAGRRPFSGETVTDVLSAVLTREPDWSALPADVPAAISGVIRRCLDKDRRRRLRDIGEARVALEDPQQTATGLTPPPARLGRRRAVVPVLVISLLLLGVATAWLWQASGRPASGARAITRFDVSAPEPAATLTLVFRPTVALSANGATLAFVATSDGVDRIYVRTRENAVARAIPGSESGSNPALSPDGRWVAFFADAKVRKAPIDGEAMTIADAPDVRGLSWLDAETLILSRNAMAPLVRMPASGGQVQPLTTLAGGERSHRWVDALPGGRSALFTVGSVASPDSYDNATVEAVDLASGTRHVVLAAAAMAHYCGDGWLMYSKGPGLVAIRFDPRHLTTSGSPIQVLSAVARDASTGAAHFACASDGTLAFVPGSSRGELRQLTWFDDSGRQQPVPLPAGPFQEARISPDGKRAALLHGTAGGGDVWIYEFESGNFSRLTFTATNAAPMWDASGSFVYYSAFLPDGVSSTLWKKRADGGGDAESLGTSPGRAYVVWVSPDERSLILDIGNPLSDRGDIVRMQRGSSAAAEKLVATSANEYTGAVSPGGDWLAYNSDETGRPEVYVRDLRGSGRWQVTSSGGLEPNWSADGRELFYRSGNRLMAVRVEMASAFRVGRARPLFDAIYSSGIESGRSYHVDPVSRRFLLVRPADDSPSRSVRVVLNWNGPDAGAR